MHNDDIEMILSKLILTKLINTDVIGEYIVWKLTLPSRTTTTPTTNLAEEYLMSNNNIHREHLAAHALSLGGPKFQNTYPATQGAWRLCQLIEVYIPMLGPTPNKLYRFRWSKSSFFVRWYQFFNSLFVCRLQKGALNIKFRASPRTSSPRWFSGARGDLQK